MGLSKLSARCRACPFVDVCDHKRMEACGFLPLPPQQESIPLMQFAGSGTNDPQGQVSANIDIDALVKEAARVFQIPERLLRGDY